MPEFLSLVTQTARASVRRRNDLILENLLLRHQLQLALPSKRRLSLRRRDRFLWVLVRQLRPDLAPLPSICPTGNGHSLAPKWLAIVLAVEIEKPGSEPAAAG